MPEIERQLKENALDASLNRRDLLKGLVGGAIVAAGIPRENLQAQEIERNPLLKDLPPTTLSLDTHLAERQITPITNVELNPDLAQFAELSPSNPQERLDMAVLKLFATLDAIQDDYKNLPAEKLSNDEMMQNPLWVRANAAETPQLGDIEHFARLLDRRSKYRLPLWAYDPEEKDNENFKLFDVDPKKGVEIKLLSEPPLVVSYYGANQMPGYGFTPTVDKDNQLHLGIYIADKSFDYDANSTPQHSLNYEYALQTYGTMEELILFGGRNDIHGLNSKFDNLRFSSQGAVLFPELMENLGGPMNDQSGFFSSAPYCNVSSPSIK